MCDTTDPASVDTAAVLVARLRELLGARLVVYLGGVHDTRTVQDWSVGEGAPPEPVVARLRAADRTAAVIAEHDAPAVVQAWFLGATPILSDRAPARGLVEDLVTDSGALVLAAARAFSQRG